MNTGNPTATVTLTISKFNPAPTPCEIQRPVVNPPTDRLTNKSSDPSDFAIVAHGSPGRPLNIQFVIAGDGACSPRAGKPVTFDGTNGPANFPQQTVSGSSVTVTDVFVNSGKGPNKPSWKYSIAVVSQNGVAGIIDPDIENETQE